MQMSCHIRRECEAPATLWTGVSLDSIVHLDVIHKEPFVYEPFAKDGESITALQGSSLHYGRFCQNAVL